MQGYFLGGLAALIWSGFILVSRQGGISELNAFDVIAIRYTVCAILLLPLWWFKFRFNLLDVRVVTAAMVGGLAYAVLAFSGFEQASGSHAAILLPGAMPLLILLLSSWLNNERHGLRKYFGVALITLGIGGLLMEQGLAGNGGAFGLLIGAALCWSIYSVLIQRWQISPWQGAISLALITCVIYMPVYILLLPKSLGPDNWSRLLADIALQAFYQGFIATIVQMLLFVRAVQLIGPSNMGVMMAAVPIIAGVSALYVFNETASPALLWGFVLVSLGSLLVHLNLEKVKNALR